MYSDSSQFTLKDLKNTEVDINNILIITEDFNIRNSSWNLLFPHHSSHSNFLIDVTTQKP